MPFSINKKKFVLGSLGIIVSVFFILLIAKKVDFSLVIESLLKVNPFTICLMVLIYLSSFFFRAIRWKLMLKNEFKSTFKQCFRAIIIGFAGNNFIPARGGELLRMEVFSRDTKLNRVTTLSSVLIEKILDGLVLVFFLLVVLFFNSEFLNENWLKNLTLLSSFLFISILLLLILFRIYGSSILLYLDSIKGKYVQKITSILTKIYSAISFINWSFNSIKILILGFLIWAVECLVYLVALIAFDVGPFPIYESLLTLSIVNFGLLVPSSPGYVGVFQGMTILALMIFSIDQATALSISLLIHSCQFFPITILGIILILKLRIFFSKIRF